MPGYKELIYYKEEKSFGSSISPYVPSPEATRFSLSIFHRRTSKRALFRGIASIFISEPTTIVAMARTKAEDPRVVSWVRASTRFPNKFPAEITAGFVHDATTIIEYRRRDISTVLRSLLAQAFEGTFTPEGKTKMVGLILKTNEASLRARYFIQDPESHQYYYTTVTGETKDNFGREMFIVTTDVTKRCTLVAQILRYEQETGYAFIK